MITAGRGNIFYPAEIQEKQTDVKSIMDSEIRGHNLGREDLCMSVDLLRPPSLAMGLFSLCWRRRQSPRARGQTKARAVQHLCWIFASFSNAPVVLLYKEGPSSALAWK